MKPRVRNKRLWCEKCGQRTEHVPLGRPVSRGERARAIWLGLAAFVVVVCVLFGFVQLYDAYLKEYFALLPHLLSCFVQGGIAGGIGVGVLFALLGPHRVQIVQYGQWFEWQCSLCWRIRPPKR